MIEEAEQQGGAHLSNEVCRPESFRLNLPINENDPNGRRGNQKLTTTGCRRRGKFLVPMLPDAYIKEANVLRNATHTTYEKNGDVTRRPAEQSDFDFDDTKNPQSLMSDGTPTLAKVCAVDDAMGLWPRFNAVMHTGESFEEV